MSAPASPGERNKVSANGSAATTTSALASWARVQISSRLMTLPSVSGYCNNMPKQRVGKVKSW